MKLPAGIGPLGENMMKRRFEVRKKELVSGAEIKPQVYAGLVERLPGFLEPYVACVGRRERKEHLRTYLQGLLSDAERKNVESIAYLHDQDRQELQDFIGGSQWAYEPMLNELTREVGTELGETDGVIVIDPSGFEKDGKASVGVQRQWLGRQGKVDNGQVGIYLGYVSRKGQALCDVRLYLPKEWARDRQRRRKCGVPGTERFRTRHALAKEMLLARAPWLPHRWVSGDVEMGRCSGFRGWLRQQSEPYVLAVPANTSIRDLEVSVPPIHGPGRKPKSIWTTVSAWLQNVPAEQWKRIDVRDGEKGPLVVEALACRVQAREENRRVGPEELLFVTRVQECGGWKIDYYLSNACVQTSL